MPKFGFYQTEHRNNNFFSFVQKHSWEIPKHPLLYWPTPSNYKELDSNCTNLTSLKLQSISSRDFCVFSARLAFGLKQAGISSGNRVLIAIPLSFQYLSYWFALIKIGAVPVILDEWWDNEFIDESLKLSQCHGVIFSEHFHKSLGEKQSFTRISTKISVGKTSYPSPNSTYEDMIKDYTEAETLSIHSSHPATIHYTRDSHKKIIGIKRDHKQLAAQQFTLRRYFNTNKNEKYLSFFPSSIINSIALGIQSLIPLQRPSLERHQYIELLISQIKTAAPTSVGLKVSMLEEVYEKILKNKINLDSVQHVYLGLDGHRSDLIKKLKIIFPNTQIRFFFGTPEIEPISTISNIEGYDHKDESNQSKYVGILDKSITCKILKRSNDIIKINDLMDWVKWELPKDEEGEIVVAAEHAVREYHKNDEAFKRNKIIDDFDIVWHRTGIIGHLDKDNHLWVSGEK